MANEGILLQAGTNEMEMLVFRLGDSRFGVNVAKVREIVLRESTIAIPHAPAIVEGSFRLREEVLTLVNVGRFFDMQGAETLRGEGLIIILEFNRIRCGVLVDAVEMIHRLRWSDIEPPSPYLAGFKVPVTGIVTLESGIVLIADFESIICENLGLNDAGKNIAINDLTLDPGAIRVLMADDSPTIRSAIAQTLRRAGFQDVTVCVDGKSAWEALEKVRDGAAAPYDVVVTDIEMPEMDGFTLTMRIKEDPRLRETPVILFSSLISEDNAKKGESVGADMQVTKFEGDTMVKAIETCVLQAKGARPKGL